MTKSKISASTFWLLAQSGIRLIFAAITTRVIAQFLSPSQYFAYSQAQTLLQILATISSSIATAKYSSIVANAQNAEELASNNNSAFTIATILSLAQGIAVVLFINPILKYSNLEGYEWAVLTLPLAAWLAGVIAITHAVFTGLGNAVKFSKSAIAASAIASVSTISFTVLWGLHGAILSALASSVAMYICLRIAFRIETFKLIPIRSGSLINEATEFAAFSLVIGVAQYSAHIYIKTLFAQESSANEAGLYAAASKVSELYMGVLAVLYANKLVNLLSTTHENAIRSLVLKLLTRAAPILLLAFILATLLSKQIIPIMFGEQYSHASGHLRYILIADYLKCIYWIFAYFIISTKASRLFFTIEIFGIFVYLVAASASFRYTNDFNPQIGMLSQSVFLLAAGSFSFFRLTRRA